MAQLRVVPEINEDIKIEEDFATLLQEEDGAYPQEGTVINGTILAIENDNVLIDIGFKTEGRVQIKEFPRSERDDLAPGDQVEVFVERVENARSEAVLSRERAVREESWARLEKSYNDEEPVDGVIFNRVKGGYTVDLDGAVAFLPGSQVDVRPVKDVTPLMNVNQPFQILKMDRRRGNIVVSRRAIMEESRSAERDEALETMQEGAVVEGIIKNITDYGAFVDLGAVDGLLHVTDISWQRVNHPSEVLKIGETVKLKIIKHDEKTKRISLGMKQLEDNPWSDAAGKFNEGDEVKGTITNITDYGAFVELEAGVEGLVHVSEMSWTKKNIQPSKIVTVGQEVKVKILAIEEDKQRLSLGMKQCEENPWTQFANDNQAGKELEGEVVSKTEFGLFVNLGDNIEGLVHVTDITWEDNADEALKAYNKGDKVNVKVLDVDTDKERISLGIKQLSDDPFAGATQGTKKGSVATFEVTDVKEAGIEVKSDSGVIGFIRKGDLSKDKVDCRPDRFSVGDRVDAMVTAVDSKTRQLKLSIKAMEVEAEKKAIAEYGSADSGASLGNILGVALDSAQKEAEEKKAEKKKPAAKKATKKADKADAEAEGDADAKEEKKAAAK